MAGTVVSAFFHCVIFADDSVAQASEFNRNAAIVNSQGREPLVTVIGRAASPKGGTVEWDDTAAPLGLKIEIAIEPRGSRPGY
jgi:hypothetical protein